MTADERLLAIANDLVAEAFCADWHDDPYMGVREVERIKSLFVNRINNFVCDEISRVRLSLKTAEEK